MKTPPDRTFYKNKEQTLREAEVTAHTNVGRVKSTMRVLSLSAQKPPFPAEPPRHSRPFLRQVSPAVPLRPTASGCTLLPQRLTYFTIVTLYMTRTPSLLENKIQILSIFESPETGLGLAPK